MMSNFLNWFDHTINHKRTTFNVGVHAQRYVCHQSSSCLIHADCYETLQNQERRDTLKSTSKKNYEKTLSVLLYFIISKKKKKL